jgi:MoaA/NifB/PqqE/SkfB family radical SAM enzyme
LLGSTICQLKCPNCATPEGAFARFLGSQTLKFEHFKNFVDANPWLREIEIAGEGEIFLNPDILRILKYACQKKVTLTAYSGSNLNTLSEEVIEGIVKYKLHFLNCSIDGASNKTYQIYRRGGDLKKVIANIKTINKFKALYRSELPRLQWQFIVFGHNEHEILRAKMMALKLGMSFRPRIAWGNFSPVKNKDLVKKVTGLDATDRDEYREKHGKIYLTVQVCSQMWVQPQINADGRVLGCCMNRWSDYGNAFKEDLIGILNSERMNYARAMLLGKKEEREDIPCVHCPWYREMKMTNRWAFSRKKVAYA